MLFRSHSIDNNDELMAQLKPHLEKSFKSSSLPDDKYKKFNRIKSPRYSKDEDSQFKSIAEAVKLTVRIEENQSKLGLGGEPSRK